MSSTSQGMCGGPSGNEGSLQVSSEETKQIKKKVGVGLGVKETKNLPGLWLLLLKAGLGGVLGPVPQPDLRVQ